jgi:hypothetical protein
MPTVSNKSAQKSKHTFCGQIYFENRGLRNDVEQYCRVRRATDGNAIRRMRFASCISKATHMHANTHTLRICNTCYLSTTMSVARTRLSVTLCADCCPVSAARLYGGNYQYRKARWRQELEDGSCNSHFRHLSMSFSFVR